MAAGTSPTTAKHTHDKEIISHMFTITSDPIHDAAMYDREQDDYDASLYPDCDVCGELIAPGDEYVDIDGTVMHYECAENWLMKIRQEMPERG